MVHCVKNPTAVALVAARVQVRSPAWCSGLKDLVLGQFLAGELPYAFGVAIKKKKRVGQYLKLGSKYMDVD